MRRFVHQGVLGGWLMFASACGRDRVALPVRGDATPVLRVPAVATVIRAYLQRNHAQKLGLFYVKDVRHGDTTSIELSSLVYRSEAEALAPCDLIRLHDEWVLVKARDCAPAADLDSLLRRVPKAGLVDTRQSALKYRVQASGDTAFLLPEQVFYHPEVLTMLVHHDRISTSWNSQAAKG
jgi:hypothetical protein